MAAAPPSVDSKEDIDRENGQTLYISLLLDRKGNRVLSFLPRFLSLFIHVSRSIYCESILNDIFFTHLYSTIIDFFQKIIGGGL